MALSIENYSGFCCGDRNSATENLTQFWKLYTIPIEFTFQFVSQLGKVWKLGQSNIELNFYDMDFVDMYFIQS